MNPRDAARHDLKGQVEPDEIRAPRDMRMPTVVWALFWLALGALGTYGVVVGFR